MNGAELLIQTAAAQGSDVCFANPGTTEIPLVVAIDRNPAMRGVLCLFEGVATGAADGWARMTGRPGLTLVHLGPGFANGMANLHNARRGRSKVVNLIGDHATWHVDADPPLAMDIAAAAGSVSGWVGAIRDAAHTRAQMLAALAAAQQGQVASLSVPHDLQLADVGPQAADPPAFTHAPVDAAAVDAAARLLRSGRRVALIVGGNALLEPGQFALARIGAATGCDIYAEFSIARIDRGRGRLEVARVPYYPEKAQETLGVYDAFILVDARRPVAFFGWPGAPSYYTRDDQEHLPLGGGGQDILAVLAALADALDAPAMPTVPAPAARDQGTPTGPLTDTTIGAVLAAAQPEGAIIVNEGVTTGRAYPGQSVNAPPHTMLNQPGGAIGLGIPLATGAAVACPDRAVIDLQADGSAMYTVQALWTQARERLNVTTLICNNGAYNILGDELDRAEVATRGPALAAMVDLGNPAIGWTQLAQGMGVDACAVDTAEELAAALTRALAEPGPHLIDMRVATS